MHLIKKCGLSMILALCLLFTGCNSITQIDPSEEPITQSDLSEEQITQSDLSEEQKIQKIKKGMTIQEVREILGPSQHNDCLSVLHAMMPGWQINEDCVLRIKFAIKECPTPEAYQKKLDEARAQEDFSMEDWMSSLKFEAVYAVIIHGTGKSMKEEVLFE